MKPYYSHAGITIYHGDCREVLPQIEGESVNSIVTSPPYWGLRNYGSSAQIGLEPTPEAYRDVMTDVFKECRRGLSKDGTFWLNIGDCYHNGRQGWLSQWSGRRLLEDTADASGRGFHRRTEPATTSIAEAKGFSRYSMDVWAKPNCMPESTEDRTTRSHEYVFLFSKSERYWYNAEAVRTAPKASTATRLKQDITAQIGSERANGGAKTNGNMKAVARKTNKQRGHSRRHAGFNDRWDQMEKSEQMEDGGNLRSVWWISPAQFEEEHYAVMPERVAQICILAGAPTGGLVLDPFSGPGTTLLVAKQSHCRAIGIELEEKYCEFAAKRLSQEVFQFEENQ